jgi:hypothetical protein
LAEIKDIRLEIAMPVQVESNISIMQYMNELISISIKKDNSSIATPFSNGLLPEIRLKIKGELFQPTLRASCTGF